MTRPPPESTPARPLDVPLKTRRGVGPERASQLARLRIHTVDDLLLHRPRRYEDRRYFCAVADLQLGKAATVRGKIVALGVKRWRGGSKSLFEFILDDGTARLHCRWWNLPFMEKYFQQGEEVLVYGKPNSLKPRTIDHPETEIVKTDEENFVHLNRIVPIYPLTEGLPQRWLRSFIWQTLQEYESYILEPWNGLAVPASAGSRPPQGGIPDLPGRAAAVHMLHFPEETSDAELARQRLALDEFLELQVAVQRRRKNLLANAKGLPCAGDNHLIKPFLKQLGFTLTEAQTRVLRQIRRDMSGSHPMRRLLQGDVGSGKTVVAACAALMALESGFNVALMAPTEILAAQHFQVFSHWFESLGIRVELRT
ncbi:MAG: ATP-dependent DNA helicase RecG, partial [Verrucomicrobia bacterium]